VSGVAAAKLPPSAKNTLPPPSSIAWIASTVSRPFWRGGSKPNTCCSRSSSATGGFSQMPMVRSPCTLLWPRTGQAPAPSRPMWPHSMSQLTIIWMVATECWCCVMPMPQQAMTLPGAQVHLGRGADLLLA
jgi:hypothetical protein